MTTIIDIMVPAAIALVVACGFAMGIGLILGWADNRGYLDRWIRGE